MLSLRVKTSFSYVEFSGGVIIPPSFVQKRLEVTSDAALQSGEQLQEKVFAKAAIRCPSLHLIIVLLTPLRTNTSATVGTVRYRHLSGGLG